MTMQSTKQRLGTGVTVLAMVLAGAFAFGSVQAATSPVASGYIQDTHGSHTTHSSGHGSSDHGSGHESGQSKGKGSKGGNAEAGHYGGGGSKSVESKVLRSTDEGGGPTDSDGRGPKYSGGKGSTGKPTGAGTKKGDLYGDAIVILRDANGVPILDQYGHVQPLDADGNLIPINEEGEIESGYEDLAVEVEFSRLSVARAPSKVMENSYNEAIDTLNAADAISLDAAGRLVVTIDGVEKTIDSPLENLALYETLMDKGFLPGLNLKDGVSLGDLSFLSDPSMTDADLLQAASFFAAASDKTSTLNNDMVVYLNTFLGVTGTDPLTGADGKTYFDFSDATYDRATTYDGTVTYLKSNDDGTYSVVTEPIMTAVFGDENYTGTQLDAFTQAADDSRAVIEFVHEHPIPAE